ncbi:transposase [Escherichia coli]|nr:transposase [Escherichia coli]GDP65938.1 transposase [Escherichia coli]GDP76899.1 transposase [Escherichia coli]
MELKKLMEHISIIPDYRQAWKVEHKLSDILLLTICAVISGAEGWEDIEDFGETHLDFLKQYGDFENGIPVHDTIARVVSCISPAKFHECFINWMRDCHSSDDKTSLQLMEKRSGTLMTRVAARERFMSLVRSQQCTVWFSGRLRRMRNPMRLQPFLNFLTCWILKEKSSQLMRWDARKILQRRYKNRAVIIYSR